MRGSDGTVGMSGKPAYGRFCHLSSGSRGLATELGQGLQVRRAGHDFIQPAPIAWRKPRGRNRCSDRGVSRRCRAGSAASRGRRGRNRGRCSSRSRSGQALALADLEEISRKLLRRDPDPLVLQREDDLCPREALSHCSANLRQQSLDAPRFRLGLPARDLYQALSESRH